MAGRRKLPKHTGQLKKNIFLFALSVSVLIGASWLFLNIIELPGLPFSIEELKSKDIVSVIKSKFSKKEIEDRHLAKADSKKEEVRSSVSQNDYKYSFYDVLSHQKQGKHVNAGFSIQIDSFKTTKQAEEFRGILEKENRLNCRVIKKGNEYAVLWSSFPTKKTAERYRKQLSAMLDIECEVVEK